MRKLTILLPVLVSGAFVAPPAAAQSFRPAVATTELPPLEKVWHLRSALNVAALGCRDGDEAATVAAYNDMLHRDDAVFDTANAVVDARYKVQFGAKWESAREHAMTQLYNFFAQPAAQGQFCAVAKDVLARIASVPPSDLPAFAEAALPQLEQPFWPTPSDQIAANPVPSAVVAVSAAVSIAPGVIH
ncbi:MAG: hypothetical protein J0I47_12215 [Sphingomonas sp.]|uniref:hypothetical protein n=1 Tax=Sphingomonas sp. TaxID=28214 RepID=UPI001AC9B9CD|nr:hypothetical protein [Sphingomonas sp.]MBN8808980.1 hypothetical protein [Sphingomonas sp.]